MVTRDQLFLLVLVLLGLPFPSWASPSCDAQWSRQVVDALLNRDLDLATDTVRQWRQQVPEHLSLGLHEALIEVARADYSPGNDPARYDAALWQLDGVISDMREVVAGAPDGYLPRLNLATASAVAGRLLMAQKRWLKAYEYGHESREIMQQLLDEDASRYDTYLILGMFDYFAGSLPNVLRWLSRLVDFGGDAEQGLRYLELAVERAQVASPQAAEALLVEVDHSPQQACRYVELARTMRRTYAGNPRYSWAVSRLGQRCRTLPLAQRQEPLRVSLARPHCP